VGRSCYDEFFLNISFEYSSFWSFGLAEWVIRLGSLMIG
jgi:hypothetical protein